MAIPTEPSVIGPPLLETKLYIPHWRADQVSRPRLVERLNRGSDRKLILVSAQAGFGKTTLLAEWLADRHAEGRKVGWVSLDESDNDPALFWTYAISALHRTCQAVGESALAQLRFSQPAPIATTLTALINDLAANQARFILVFDDYHVIHNQEIHDGLAFLLDHLPPQLLLVVASRSDPPLPLSRMRARGDMTEMRIADLRFTPVEAATFLNDTMAVTVSAGQVAALETRTEGWIAGLQLAALSMHGRDDTSEFVASFVGGDRFVADYLVEEVLQRQSADVRRFLLQTSVLDRLSADLCDTVLERSNSRKMLEVLERGNLFLVPLDDTRHWYRYHHLFAHVLQAHLREEFPAETDALHRRASDWYGAHELPAEAIHHALAANDPARAADLIELAAPVMRRNRQEVTLLGWLRMLPDEVVRVRPVMSMLYAGLILTTGGFDGAEERLRDVELWLDRSAETGTQPAGMVVVEHEEFRRLPTSIAVHRAGYALLKGDLPETVNHAERALAVADPDDRLNRGAAAAILGLASWTGGDLEEAYRSYAEGMANLELAGNITDTIGGAIALADIRIAQGRLREAMSMFKGGLERATAPGTPVMRGASDMHVGMSGIYREWNDLEQARQHLQRSRELGDVAGFPQNPYRLLVAMSRIQEAEDNPDGAIELLNQAQRVYVSDFYPNVRPISARIARIWLALDRLTPALEWAREQGLSASDHLTYLHEFEHITLARVLLVQHRAERAPGSLQAALQLLSRLLEAAEAGKRTGSVIEILGLQALGQQMNGDLPAALVLLERALRLAEPEQYVRLFVSEGEPMRNLLRLAAARRIAPDYTRRLLAAFDPPANIATDLNRTVTMELAEPLTGRELEILRLIAAGKRNQEIADQLFISPATVKRHIANAYGKLGVTHRVEAIARANELNVL